MTTTPSTRVTDAWTQTPHRNLKRKTGILFKMPAFLIICPFKIYSFTVNSIHVGSKVGDLAVMEPLPVTTTIHLPWKA